MISVGKRKLMLAAYRKVMSAPYRFRAHTLESNPDFAAIHRGMSANRRLVQRIGFAACA
jgi:hypothetical protein